jgi:hypothetical protein
MKIVPITQSQAESSIGQCLRPVVITSMHTALVAVELLAVKVRESLIHLT